MNTTIERLDGMIYDFSALGIITRDFIISAPSYRHSTDFVEGRHGLIDLGTNYNARSIVIDCYLKAVDIGDYALLRDELFKILQSNEAFYVIESRNPGKRWFVKVDNQFEINQIGVYGLFQINLKAYRAFAESIGTTLDPLTFDANLWQVGQGLIAEDLKYKHNANTFSIYNAGEKIDPRSLPLKITYQGASNNLEISNLTTGDTWKYTGISNSNDRIILDGIRSTKNNLSIFRNTNKRLISLNPGWNKFILNGTSGGFEISFDFRFYYL
ncbi:phage tail family protein [Cytobacillus horneckiae]|uniref:phage tail family protein n=1 Tax=Cytobacillus horneckiae TaxID=549687 RepID=UPI0034CDFA9D